MTRKPSTFSSIDQRFSARWWIRGARNVFWVALVTALIWIYADMEFTETMDMPPAVVTLAVAPSSKKVLLSKADCEVNLTLSGKRSDLEEFRRKLQEHPVIGPYDVSNFSFKEKAVKVSDIINRMGGQEAGLTVVSSSPSSIALELDDQATRPDVDVVFQPTGGTAASYMVDPPKLSIRVPQSQFERLPPSPKLKCVADLKNVSTDKPVTVKAEIVPIIGDVAVEPVDAKGLPVKSVDVTVTVAQHTSTRTFKVAVRVLTPATWSDDTWTQYNLVQKDPTEWFREIQVTGPSQDLDQLKAKTESIQAYIVLTDDDKKPVASWLTRDVTVRFPEGLGVQMSGAEKPTVMFKLERRPANGG